MSLGRVYLWAPDPTDPLGGTARVGIAPLPNLEPGSGMGARLRGSHVEVRNAGWLNVPGQNGAIVPTAFGDAISDPEGDFLFEQGHGGGRVDKLELADPDFRWRYLQASRFGEVNAYFHVDRMATYVAELLRSLDTPSLPRVTVFVNAHHGATVLDESGRRDGVRGRRHWLPFQGGHYRLSGRTTEVRELAPVAPNGEIHLGPGWQLLEDGALVRCSGGRYRANASHNPGIIYHEYGHHLTRHTADLSANDLRAPERQDNRKTALDEGMCDYWAAAMLETPHIWAFHRRHDREAIHPRSLASGKTMSDFDNSPGADPHSNGTIWAAMLWDLRTALQRLESRGGWICDRLVLASLHALRRLKLEGDQPRPRHTTRMRSNFGNAARALLEADQRLNDGVWSAEIISALCRRGIPVSKAWSTKSGSPIGVPLASSHTRGH